MKKYLPLLLCTLLFSAQSAPDAIEMAESLTPSSVGLFAYTAKIATVVETIQRVSDRYLQAAQKERFLAIRDGFKAKTGIDFLNSGSLGDAGINVEKQLSLAYFKVPGTSKEEMMLFVPVLNPETFPLRFVEIVKKMASANKDLDLNPVVTDYKGNRIFQMRRDIFFTVIGNFFVVAQNGELLRKAVDLREQHSQSLAADTAYFNYLNREKKPYAANIFIRRDLLEELYGTNVKKQIILEPDQAFFKAIDYAAFGVSLEEGISRAHLSLSFNGTDPAIDSLLAMLDMGKSGDAIAFDRADLYAFVSCNLAEFATEKGKTLPGYRWYEQLAGLLRNGFGVDVAADFLPAYRGVVNVITTPGSGIMGKFALSFPAADQAKHIATYKKIREFLAAKYRASGGFGEEKIAGGQAFWYMDPQYRKYYFFAGKKGLYYGNDPALIQAFDAAPRVAGSKEKTPLVERLRQNLFGLVYLRKDSFLASMLKQQLLGFKQAGGFIERMGDCFLVAEKGDRAVGINLDVEMLSPAAAK